MRILLAAAVATLALGPLGLNDAHAGWTCLGPSYACGPVKAKAWGGHTKKASKNKKYSKKASYSKKRKSNKRYSGKSYGGKTLYGKASYYWQHQRVASGGWFNPKAMTAAHKSLPFGTRVRVTHLGNGRSVVVRINDRGPYIKGRIIDLSKAAAGKIRMRGQGVARVKVTVLGRG